MSTRGSWKDSGLARGATLLCSAAAVAVVAPQFSGLDPLGMVLTIVLLVICLGIHEAAHGWVALRCGDPTARDLGRITINPIPHIDPVMTILLPALLFATTGRIFGGAKPVPVNFHRLRHPWRDMSLVAIAGPLSNLLLAIFFVAAFKFFLVHPLYNGAAPSLEERVQDLLPRVLIGAADFNVLLAVFNMVPIPPLDGSRVMAWLLPEGLRASYVGLERYGMLIIFGLLYTWPAFNRALAETIDAVIQWIFAWVPMGGV